MSSGRQVAIIGMGGFAREHHRVVQALERQGLCRLASTCDPEPERFAAERAVWDLAGRGTAVYDDYRRMLDAHGDALDLVTIPTPVPLHAEMHGACAERRLGIYLEKPPTLWPDELEEMIAAEAGSPWRAQVGFNFIVEAPRQALKRRLLDGEFGTLRTVSLMAAWPRPASYYRRAPWAGRLMLGDRPVLDTCLGNATAHYLHNLLFWAGGSAVLDWAPVRSMRASLYRAHAIQSADTVFADADCGSGVTVRAAASHACAGEHEHLERLVCDRAVITYDTRGKWRVAWSDGRAEEGEADRRDLLLENMAATLRYLSGDEDRPLTRLEDSRPFVHYHALAIVASGTIHTVPSEDVQRSPLGHDDETREIAGIRAALDTFARAGRFPDEQGLSWGRPPGTACPADLAHLPGCIATMLGHGGSRMPRCV